MVNPAVGSNPQIQQQPSPPSTTAQPLSTPSIVITGSARTPMGAFLGQFQRLDAPSLGAVAIQSAIARSNLSGDAVDEVYMGNVISAGTKQAPARQAALKAGVPDSVPCTTINKVCGSGMKAAQLAHNQLRLGEVNVVVAGGMESMSSAPYLEPKVRSGLRMGHHEIKDSMFVDGLEDAGSGDLMGVLAQSMADRKRLTRDEMDDFAVESVKRAKLAIDSGAFKAEIVPVTVKDRQGERTIEVDEPPSNVKIDKIPSLKPAFKTDGTVTAANSSSISDGASAMVMMRESDALLKGILPQARVLAFASHAQAPADFTTAPLGAIEKVLAKVGWSVDDVDRFEINEAFALVAQLPIKALGISHDKVNVFGGACALGHPLGSSASRIMITLMSALEQAGLSKGVAAVCIGGGEAMAVALERYDVSGDQ